MKYTVMVEKKYLKFSSSHFVVEGERCEGLHGHNYHTAVEIEGTLNEVGYVIDFINLKRMISDIISPLDHKVLVASKNPSLSIKEKGEETEISSKKKRYVFPHEECILLPLINCTAEYLATYILSCLKSKLLEAGYTNVVRVKVGVEESDGQWGFVEEEITP